MDYGSIIICYERQVAGDKFLRMSSLSSGLDWRHVRLAGPGPQVSFVKTNNSEARGVPLHERVVAELANLEPRQDEVFRRPDGRPYSRPRNSNDTSAGSRISARLCTSAGGNPRGWCCAMLT